MGFTLMECLTVVAIIAIVAAFILPVFMTAREAIRRTNCLSNVRQIGSALRLYSQDWDERYPMNRFGVTAPLRPAAYTWKTAIAPYLRNTGVFRCPSNQFFDQPVEAKEDVGRSYALNAAAGELGPLDAAIADQAEIIELSEARYRFPDVYPSEAPWSSFRYSWGDLPAPNAPFGAIQTHGGRSNFAFYDGHAGTLKVVGTIDKHRPLTMWHYSVFEPRNYGSQTNFDQMRERWRGQLLAHSEYR